jgi:glycosyltransferase involved in cell wall biosynthesis
VNSVQSIANKPRKIGVFNYGLNGGGAERVVTSLISLWEKNGHFVVLFTDENIDDIAEFPVSESTECVVLPKESSCRLAAWKEAVDKYELELLVHHQYPAKSLKSDAEHLSKIGVKIIVIIHDSFSAERYGFDPWNNSLLKGLPYTHVDTLVCLSPVEALWWGMLLKRPARYIPNPLTVLVCNDEEKIAEASKEILWIGRFIEGKRLEDAIKAFAIISETHADTILTVLGSSGRNSIDRKYQNLAYRLGVGTKVKFMGKQKDVTSYFRRATLHLITSASESFGLTIAESKMLGVPIVMYELPNLSLTKDRKGILTAEWGNVKDLADKLSYILDNDEYRKKLGDEGLLSIGEFSDDKILKQWNNIFVNLIDNKGLNDELHDYQTIENYHAIVYEMMRSWDFFMRKNYWKIKIFEKLEQYINTEWIKKLMRDRWPHVF